MKTLCHAPAKLILSGEHSVVYGKPGLSMAVDLPTQCDIEFTPAAPPFIEIELVNYQQKHAFPFDIWQKLALNIEARFQLFQQEINAIQTVLQHPVDLILVALYHFHAAYTLKSGHWNIKIKSHHLPSRGLGSSAAVILSLLGGLFKTQNIKHHEDTVLTLAQAIESRQHGTSSGIDPTTIMQGGLLRYQQHTTTLQLESHSFHAWLIDTGPPSASTGKSVEKVSKRFSYNDDIWQAFEKVTEQVQSAWQQQDADYLCSAIRSNQQLLEKIGIVPLRVKKFIEQLHVSEEVAAKVCGAGSVQGDHAGIILCISPNAPRQLCQEYGFEIFPLVFQSEGLTCTLTAENTQ